MLPAQAVGRHYFAHTGCPLAVLRVADDPAGQPSHDHDLTEIEHDHDFSELVLVTAGRATHHLRGTAYPVAAGDVYLLRSTDRHYFADRDGLELLNILVDPAWLNLPTNELIAIPGFSAMFVLEPRYRRQHRFQSRLFLPPAQRQHAHALALAINDELDARQPGYAVAARTKLLELIIYLARQYDRAPTPEGKSLLRVGQLITQLEQHSDQPWTLESMARLAHMSPSNLVRVFRRATGQSPNQHLIQLRLRHALRLLEDDSLNLTQVALRAGFTDGNYFSRQFRQAFGTSPSQYRRQHYL